jgi:hypothetical protein
MSDRHPKNEYKNRVCKKHDCKNHDCKNHDCKKSESTESCEQICTPKFIYKYCRHNKCSTLSLTYIITTPNSNNPPTFTCPDQIGQKITIIFTITNDGNLNLCGPIMLYNSLSCTKVAAKKLAAGQSVDVTVKHRITQADCDLGSISVTANAFVNLDNCVMLVSQPVSIKIANGTTTPCCAAINQALGNFELQLASIGIQTQASLDAAFPPPTGMDRVILLAQTFGGIGTQFATAIQQLIDKNCDSECCQYAAKSLQDTAIGIASLASSAATTGNVPYTGLGTYPVVAPIPFNLAQVLAGIVGNDAFTLPPGSGLPIPPVPSGLVTQLNLILSTITC